MHSQPATATPSTPPPTAPPTLPRKPDGISTDPAKAAPSAQVDASSAALSPRRKSSETDDRINRVIDAIIKHNSTPELPHDEKWAITINALKSFVKSQRKIERHLKPFEDSLSKQVKESLKTAKQKTQTILGNTDPKSLLGQAALIGNDLMQLGRELETMRTSVGGKRLAAVEKAVRELNKLNQQVTEHRQQVCKL